jgi:AcrR family transcriptional regulator
MHTTSTPDDTRRLILETAREHLRRFGEHKMTIVDVAKSLGMSHANVYRYFRNKAEILDVIVDEWLAKVEELLDPIVRQQLPARVRIENVVLEIYRRRRQKLQADAEVFETFRRIVASRPDAVALRIKKIHDVFSRLISDGIASGEFASVDPAEAAAALEDATAIFLHPLMTAAFMSETTEARLRNVLTFVLSGIRRGVNEHERLKEAGAPEFAKNPKS